MLLMLGMPVTIDETEVTASQADSSDDADADDDDDDDDNDDNDKEWMNDGCDVSQLNNTQVLTTRRVTSLLLATNSRRSTDNNYGLIYYLFCAPVIWGSLVV